ncbi:ornithine uptake porin CarO [Acinetobacter sp. ANC 5414]|uniref:ornithine uptake porin CarO n=1 Tax=Acinetobacter sp. ANC 5414 TaxID=2731251 RepID=UPI00149054E4|nr:ornithine uptake porin CarO [Acinetobacter sp. ANC 5414]NNH01412.1 ornithine uptake porin CarO [Acinetobacter sp. ANC 5414]
MKTLSTILAATVLTAIAGTAIADDAVVQDGYSFDRNQLIPTGVRAEVGTTGYGGALLWTANPYVGLALGYNGGDISWSDDLSVDGVKYDVDMDNKLAYLNAEIRPWGASENRWAQALYMAAGVGYLDSEYGLKSQTGSGTIEIDGKPTRFSSVNGNVSYENDISPYLGLGFAPKINKNWGVFGEVGAYYTGNPKASLTGVGGTDADQTLLAEHERNIENDDEYQWLPVGKVGVSYHW